MGGCVVAGRCRPGETASKHCDVLDKGQSSIPINGRCLENNAGAATGGANTVDLGGGGEFHSGAQWLMEVHVLLAVHHSVKIFGSENGFDTLPKRAPGRDDPERWGNCCPGQVEVVQIVRGAGIVG